jgi:phosphatidylglycerol---prolipoprotein diacylglyceryl transferase
MVVHLIGSIIRKERMILNIKIRNSIYYIFWDWKFIHKKNEIVIGKPFLTYLHPEKISKMILSYIVWNVKPQIHDFGSFEIRYYSILFGLGFILGYYVLSKIFKREGIPNELLDKLVIYVILATILGARLGHCLFYEPEVYLVHPLKIFLPFEGTIGKDFRFTGYQGLASHGGVIGLLIAMYLYARKFKVPFLWITDRLAIVGPLAGAFIRIGNFFNSEITGTPTNLPWGVKFMQGWDSYDAAAGQVLPKHPAQLYEALAYLAIFVFILWYYNHNFGKNIFGRITGYFFLLTFLARFLIEFVKDDQVNFERGMILNMGQILSIPFIILGIYLIYRKSDVKPIQFATPTSGNSKKK